VHPGDPQLRRVGIVTPGRVREQFPQGAKIGDHLAHGAVAHPPALPPVESLPRLTSGRKPCRIPNTQYHRLVHSAQCIPARRQPSRLRYSPAFVTTATAWSTSATRFPTTRGGLHDADESIAPYDAADQRRDGFHYAEPVAGDPGRPTLERPPSTASSRTAHSE
jgi:hypothetical protein